MYQQQLFGSAWLDCTGTVQIFSCFRYNQLRFQIPFLIIKSLEGSDIREEPDVDDYLWVGDDQTSLPELYLTLDVTFSPENSTLDGCPSNEDITNALGELNHWVSSMHTVHDLK